MRVLVLAAHPDDAEIFAGGLLIRHCHHGNPVRIVSVTDGRCGHHQIPPQQLVSIRRHEAAAAGDHIGADYLTWDFPDGSLTPSLDLREAIIREIRSFQPDLLLTHRPFDYHPDHRAVGTAVQDASYLVTVPHICPDTPALPKDPVVAYMVDLFTRPCRLRADVILDVSAEFDTIASMLACHESQVYQWLPHHDGLTVPSRPAERFEWLRHWLVELYHQRNQHFAAELVARGLPLDNQLKTELYEVSEYARQATTEQLQLLFPGFH